jgi:Phage integrase family
MCRASSHERRLARRVALAAASCPSLKVKHITMHTLRHTAAMRLLLAGNDVTVIALWLGHEQVSTTNIYLHADMTHKQQAIDRTKPLAAKPLVARIKEIVGPVPGIDAQATSSTRPSQLRPARSPCSAAAVVGAT